MASSMIANSRFASPSVVPYWQRASTKALWMWAIIRSNGPDRAGHFCGSNVELDQPERVLIQLCGPLVEDRVQVFWQRLGHDTPSW